MIFVPEKPCEQAIKERIAKFDFANDYACSVFEQRGSQIINTNINSPHESVENISMNLMDGMKVNVNLAYSTATGPLAGPNYALDFFYSNTYHSEEEVVRHFDESSEHLILFVDDEPIYLVGIPLGFEEHSSGRILIDESRYFDLTKKQLEKLATASKIEIKMMNTTGTLSKETLQAIKDMASLSDLSDS